MLQHLWFNIIVIFCIISCTLDIRVDLKRRIVKPLRSRLRVIFYAPVYVCFFAVPFSLWNGLEVSHTHLTNPVAQSANIVTILIRVFMYVIFASSLYGRNRKLEKWLRRALEMQTNYFDKLPENEVSGRCISHRKWLYLSSFIACLHYATETYFDAISNDARTMFYFMIIIQHFYMLEHGGLVCYLRECFSILHLEMRQKSARFPVSRIYNQLHCLHSDLNAMHGPTMLCVLLSLLLSNSMVSYIGLLHLLMANFNGDRFDYLFGNGFYGLLLVHWYIYFMLGQNMETTIKETDMILYEYVVHGDCGYSQKEIELLVYSRSLHEATVDFCQLIQVNWSSLFCILAQTVSYIITLIQLDYVNLI